MINNNNEPQCNIIHSAGLAWLQGDMRN